MNGLESGHAVFQPRARLLKLIGAELISDEVVALAELVKNAHDADASMCSITFRNITGDESEIVVQDDGEGMDQETLLRRWMEPAGTTKAGDANRFTRSGRRVLGEKGVGRFAADKLARCLELRSLKAAGDSEVRAFFDWDEFDSDSRMLSEVKCRWEVRPAGQTPHGTVLKLTQLRTAWTERMFRRVSTRLSRLPSPFETQNSFRIRIESTEFPEYSGELRSDLLNLSPYSIDAVFDGHQTVKVNLNGARSVRHLWNGTGDLRCGPVHVKLFGFDLESESIAKIGPPAAVRAWLREWSGVSIYRDGFRIWPYGEPHDDWLRLDQRRVNNPVVRLSNNQLLGFVSISRDENPELTDQTNREGLINNRPFQDLRRLLYFLLQILEAERQSIRHPRPSSKPAATPQSSCSQTLNILASGAPPELRLALKRIAKEVEHEALRTKTQHQRMIEGYSELAAIGQAAIRLSEWAEPLRSQILGQQEKVRRLIHRGAKPALVEQLDKLQGSLDVLFARLNLIAPLGRTNGRRGRVIDIAAEIRSFRSMIAPFLDTCGVRMLAETPRNSALRVQVNPESFWRILLILTINSVDWLHDTRSAQVRVKARAKGEWCEILFSDNGPGIRPQVAEKVFEPLFSTKEGGKGMGLTIAREILVQHRGRIEVSAVRGRGARFVINLRRKSLR